MTGSAKRFVCGVAFAAVCCVPALGAGPVHGEFGTVWWSNDLDTQTVAASSSTDGSAPGFRAELWVANRYGVKASQFTSDTDAVGSSDAEYTSFDVMWRPLAPTKNSFLAVGLGWQQSDLGNVGSGSGETSGPRVSFEGGMGIVDQVFAYGTASYAPELDDSTDALGGQLNDLSGYEYELGVGWKIAPWISFRGGYRVSEIDFTQSTAAVAGTTKSGFTPTTFGGGIIGMDSGSEPPDPSAAAITVGGSGSVESSGFFVGLGLRF